MQKPNADVFRRELLMMLKQAKDGGMAYLDIRSGDLHRKVGGYPDRNHAMPTCCEVMRSIQGYQMEELPGGPPKGKGATLMIRYYL